MQILLGKNRTAMKHCNKAKDVSLFVLKVYREESKDEDVAEKGVGVLLLRNQSWGCERDLADEHAAGVGAAM